LAEDASDVTPDMILAALLARVAELEADPENLREKLGAPMSALEIEDWVLRRKAEPGVIRQSDGGWITVSEGTIRPDDMLPSAQASNMPAGRNAFWCRAVEAFGVEVLADLHSDDRVIETQVDIRPWLAQASAGDIAELESEGWGYGEAHDGVAQFMEGIGNPDACRLFNYLGLRPRMSMTGDDVGFGLSVDEFEVTRWLKAHRPEALSEILSEEFEP
jgi:hypothetical protein